MFGFQATALKEWRNSCKADRSFAVGDGLRLRTVLLRGRAAATSLGGKPFVNKLRDALAVATGPWPLRPLGTLRARKRLGGDALGNPSVLRGPCCCPAAVVATTQAWPAAVAVASGLWPDAVALATRRWPDAATVATKLWTDAVAVATMHWSETRRLQLPRRRLGGEALGNPYAVRGLGTHLEASHGLCALLT